MLIPIRYPPLPQPIPREPRAHPAPSQVPCSPCQQRSLVSLPHPPSMLPTFPTLNLGTLALSPCPSSSPPTLEGTQASWFPLHTSSMPNGPRRPGSPPRPVAPLQCPEEPRRLCSPPHLPQPEGNPGVQVPRAPPHCLSLHPTPALSRGFVGCTARCGWGQGRSSRTPGSRGRRENKAPGGFYSFQVVASGLLLS